MYTLSSLFQDLKKKKSSTLGRNSFIMAIVCACSLCACGVCVCVHVQCVCVHVQFVCVCVCVCNLQAILFNRIILPKRTAETGERQITLQARASRISNTQKAMQTDTHKRTCTHKHTHTHTLMHAHTHTGARTNRDVYTSVDKSWGCQC